MRAQAEAICSQKGAQLGEGLKREDTTPTEAPDNSLQSPEAQTPEQTPAIGNAPASPQSQAGQTGPYTTDGTQPTPPDSYGTQEQDPSQEQNSVPQDLSTSPEGQNAPRTPTTSMDNQAQHNNPAAQADAQNVQSPQQPATAPRN